MIHSNVQGKQGNSLKSWITQQWKPTRTGSKIDSHWSYKTGSKKSWFRSVLFVSWCWPKGTHFLWTRIGRALEFLLFVIFIFLLRINATFTINTDLAQGIRQTARASLTWPSLAPDRPIKFPLTHIGNYSLKYFSIENPADVPVVVQIVSLSTYPKPQGLLDVIADR